MGLWLRFCQRTQFQSCINKFIKINCHGDWNVLHLQNDESKYSIQVTKKLESLTLKTYFIYSSRLCFGRRTIRHAFGYCSHFSLWRTHNHSHFTKNIKKEPCSSYHREETSRLFYSLHRNNFNFKWQIHLFLL